MIAAGALGHLAAEDRLGVIASLTLMVVALGNERAGTAAAFRRPRRRGGGGRRVRAAWLPRRPGARRRVHMAAPERPGVELRRQQLPHGEGAAGVRRAVLEPGQRP